MLHSVTDIVLENEINNMSSNPELFAFQLAREQYEYVLDDSYE